MLTVLYLCEVIAGRVDLHYETGRKDLFFILAADAATFLFGILLGGSYA